MCDDDPASDVADVAGPEAGRSAGPNPLRTRGAPFTFGCYFGPHSTLLHHARGAGWAEPGFTPVSFGQIEASGQIEIHAVVGLLGALATASAGEMRAMVPSGLSRRDRDAGEPPIVLQWRG